MKNLKVSTKKGCGVVVRDFGKNVSVRLDAKDRNGRTQIFNFSKDEIKAI